MWSEDHESDAEKKADDVPAQLEQLFAQIPEGVEYEARVTKGPIEDTVLFVARGLPADLIIMGTHGKSSGDHDSLTERIVIQAPCSVLTIGESFEPSEVFDAVEHPPVEQMRFLVPVDFSGRFQGILRFAMGIAQAMPHAVDLLHVVRLGHDTEQEEREVAAAKERLAALVPESLTEKVAVHARVGDPVEEILRAAEEMEPLCVVMGAHGKGMLKRFLFGTTTLSILHGAKCPVWFVPPALV
jgi:nucleotide-binding universal stress UspA family protein